LAGCWGYVFSVCGSGVLNVVLAAVPASACSTYFLGISWGSYTLSSTEIDTFLHGLSVSSWFSSAAYRVCSVFTSIDGTLNFLRLPLVVCCIPADFPFSPQAIFYFIFCLFILAFDLYRSWRRTFCPVFLSAVRAVAARCKLPFCPPPRPIPRCRANKGRNI